MSGKDFRKLEHPDISAFWLLEILIFSYWFFFFGCWSPKGQKWFTIQLGKMALQDMLGERWPDPNEDGWWLPETFWVNEHYLFPDWIIERCEIRRTLREGKRRLLKSSCIWIYEQFWVQVFFPVPLFINRTDNDVECYMYMHSYCTESGVQWVRQIQWVP